MKACQVSIRINGLGFWGICKKKERIVKDFRLTSDFNWATTVIAIESFCDLLPRLFIELAFYKANKL